MVIDTLASLLSRPHGGESAAGVLFGGVMLVIALVVALFVWLFFGFMLSRIFAKANKPTLAAYIPIWNLIVILEMIGKPAWWLILYLIPGVNFLVHIYVQALLLERFGMESPMSFIVPIAGVFFPVITFGLLIWGAFGDVTYRAPSAFGAASPAY